MQEYKEMDCFAVFFTMCRTLPELKSIYIKCDLGLVDVVTFVLVHMI